MLPTRPPMPFPLRILALCVLLAGCSAQPPDPVVEADDAVLAEANGPGEFISAPVEAPPKPYDVRTGTDWPEAQLVDGSAALSCPLKLSTRIR